MRYSVNDIVRKHALRAAINHLQQTSDLCWWITLTFTQNVVERRYAFWKWHVLTKRIVKRYPGCRTVGVWARQRRGAWHVHLVASFPGVEDLDSAGDIYNGSNGSENWRWLRSAALDVGWGPQMKFRRVGYSVTDGAKLANYLGNYCTDKNGLDPVKDRGVRRLIYLGKHVRVYDMHWKSSFKRVVALGRHEHRDEFSGMSDAERHLAVNTYKKKLLESWGERYRRLLPYWFSLGWALLSAQEKEAMLSEDRFVRDYLEHGRIAYV